MFFSLFATFDKAPSALNPITTDLKVALFKGVAVNAKIAFGFDCC